jgi:moderate conductance mechanosensitive channel
VITLAIPYQEDVDRVTKILREVGADLQKDSYYGTFILEPVEVLGLDAFGDWSVLMKLRIKTVPQRQWEVGRELRKRIRRGLAEYGVQVPFPAIQATTVPESSSAKQTQ